MTFNQSSRQCTFTSQPQFVSSRAPSTQAHDNRYEKTISSRSPALRSLPFQAFAIQLDPSRTRRFRVTVMTCPRGATARLQLDRQSWPGSGDRRLISKSLRFRRVNVARQLTMATPTLASPRTVPQRRVHQCAM